MRRATIVTRAWAATPHAAAHGVFKRLSLFVAALDQVFDEIDMLVFAPWAPDLEEKARDYEAHFRKIWSNKLSVSVCAREPNPAEWPLFDRYLRPMFNVDLQEAYRNVSGRSHVLTVKRLLSRDPDLLFVHRLQCFSPVLGAAGGAELPPIAFDLDDVEHTALARQVMIQPSWMSERLRLLHVPALILRERRAIQRSAVTFVCSERDTVRMGRIGGQKTVRCVPNAIESPDKASSAAGKGLVVGFIGSFDHPPNVDSVRLLVGRIWPEILRRHPSARLRIVGKGSDAYVRGLGSTKGVTAEGFVELLDGFYDDVRLICAPIRFGSGTRVKIVEAAVYGVPVVTTRLGAEGLEFVDGKSILLADDDQGLVAHCCRLLEDCASAARIGDEARKLAQERYDRGAVIKAIRGMLEDVLREPKY